MTSAQPSAIAGRLLINGRWQDSAQKTFESRSPSHTGEVVGVFPLAGAGRGEPGCRGGTLGAYPDWRRTSRIRRAELFDNLAQIVKRETDALAQLMARECGKVVSECRAEVVEGLHMIQYVFGTGRMPMGEVLASEIAEKDAFMRRKPWGVVAVITPWNFPFAVPLWMLGPSLLEGNTAVFKPSEDTPAIGQRLVELFDEAGFPPGVVNLLHGDGRGRRGAGEESRRQRGAVHRQLRRRPAHPGDLGRHARSPRRRRDGQQERGHRLRGRPARSGRDVRPDQRLQDQRPALRLGGPDSRA